jgi:hypothetical protein
MMVDPFDLLRTHVQRQADTIQSTTAIDELIAHIIHEHERVPWVFRPSSSTSANPAVRHPRRWGSMVVGLALIVGIGTGAVVTAEVIDRARVGHPELGVMCRSSVHDQTSGIAVPASVDPIGACAALWEDGELPQIGQISIATHPSLVACTGSLGLLEVFPGEGDQVCTDLGLSPADVEALVVDPLYDMNQRVNEINALCLPPREAQQAATALLDELGLLGWRVVLRAGEGCGLVAPGDGSDRTLYVNPTPPPPG